MRLNGWRTQLLIMMHYSLHATFSMVRLPLSQSRYRCSRNQRNILSPYAERCKVSHLDLCPLLPPEAVLSDGIWNKGPNGKSELAAGNAGSDAVKLMRADSPPCAVEEDLEGAGGISVDIDAVHKPHAALHCNTSRTRCFLTTLSASPV